MWFQFSRSYFCTPPSFFPSSCGFSMAYKKWYSQIHKANLRTLRWCVFLCLNNLCFWNFHSTPMSRMYQQGQCESRHDLQSFSSLCSSLCGFLWVALLQLFLLCDVSFFRRGDKTTLSRTSSKDKSKRMNIAWRKQAARMDVKTGYVNTKDGVVKALVPEMAFALWFANIWVALWVYHTLLVLISIDHLSVGQQLLS